MCEWIGLICLVTEGLSTAVLSLVKFLSLLNFRLTKASLQTFTSALYFRSLFSRASAYNGFPFHSSLLFSQTSAASLPSSFSTVVKYITL